MARTLMLLATEAGLGKSVVALGLVEQFERGGARCAYFKPVGLDGGAEAEPDLDFLCRAMGWGPDRCRQAVTAAEVGEAVRAGRKDEVLDRILEVHGELAERFDVVVCEGVDSMANFPMLEGDINADIARNIGAEVILVAGCSCPEEGADGERIVSDMLVHIRNMRERGLHLAGLLVNRVEPRRQVEVSDACRRAARQEGLAYLGALPELPVLSRPTVGDIVRALDARVLAGRNAMEVRIGDVFVAAMGMENVLHHLTDGCLILTPGDREEILLAAGAAFSSHMARPSAVALTGGFEPRRRVLALVESLTGDRLPVLQTDRLTYEAAIAVEKVHPSLLDDLDQKAAAVRGAFEEFVEVDRVVRQRPDSGPVVVTPRRFLRRLRDLAARDRKRIVLPEGDVDRILKAADQLRRTRAVEPVLCGLSEEVERRAAQLGLDLAGVEVVDPHTDPAFEDYVHTLVELRKHKGLPESMARDLMHDRTYFATMMVHKGRVDGMVSGATTTTQATLRPAFEFIRTAPGFKTVSSVFFMCLPDRVLVYGDCAVIPNPTVEQLAEIAIASAQTAASFGIEPRVAMLSYSTGDSGKGEDVDRVREATRLVRERRPDLLVEGPIQYDAAIDPTVARTKMPDSQVAGRATVFVFPDLNTGNNTYKAVQRSAGAIAVGPILQGLRRPVNDLSRGATVTDIVNTCYVTAIQAQDIQAREAAGEGGAR